MVKLQSPNRDDPIWIPPGGSVKKGEALEAAAIREVLEETGIQVETGDDSLKLIHEYIEAPLHAIEFYFRVYERGGKEKLGADPEVKRDDQILLDLRFIPVLHFNRENVYPEYLREHIDKLLSPDQGIRHIITEISSS